MPRPSRPTFIHVPHTMGPAAENAPASATPDRGLSRRQWLLGSGAGWLLPPAWAQTGAPSARPQAAPAETVTHALSVSDEWMDWTRKDGTGMYFDLIRMVYQYHGVRTEFRLMPYLRSVQRVKDLEADGWVASYLHEQPFPLYPHYHFDTSDQVIVYLKQPPRTQPVTLATLRHQRVAWLRGFALDKFIDQPMQKTEVDSVDSAIRMLDKHRVDYFVVASSYLADYLRNSRTNFARFDKVYALDLKLYMAFANTPRGAQLCQMWDSAMDKLHTTPAFKAIYKKYGYPYPFA